MAPPDLPALFLLGLVSGATLCSLGCLTHLGPVLLGSTRGFREGCRSTLHYLAGKVLVYVLWGGIAGWAGTGLVPEPGGVRWTGLLLIAAGVLLPAFNHVGCPGKLAALSKGSTLFTLGAVTSLTPCPSLLGVLAVAAGSGSATAGMACGAAFGAGLTCSPLGIAGGIVGLMAARLYLEVGSLHKVFQGFAMLMLISMGTRLLIKG